MAELKTKQPYSEAKKRANQKWDSANLDRVSVVIPKGEKEIIKAHAESKGESLNGFVVRAIHETIEKETQ